MKIYIVDTHALIWFLTKSASLSKAARKVLREAEQADAQVFVPTIVLAELLHLTEKKGLAADIGLLVERINAGGGFMIAPFDLPVFEEMRKLPKRMEIHDRVIAASAKVYGAKVISKDSEIKKVIETVW